MLSTLPRRLTHTGEYVVRVARAGKPVYVEKPMARTALECEDMISACEEAGVGLFVAYYRRAMPRFVTVKELLNSGRIGQLRSVSIRNERSAPVGEADQEGWRVDPEISGGGHFVDLGSHILDLLDWLLGPILHSAGVAANRGGRYLAPVFHADSDLVVVDLARCCAGSDRQLGMASGRVALRCGSPRLVPDWG